MDARSLLGEARKLIETHQRKIAFDTLNTTTALEPGRLHVLQGRVAGLTEALNLIDKAWKKAEGREDD